MKRRYLIVGPSWIGDMVMAQSLFISLRQQYPDCEIDVLAPQWSLPVLERMSEVRRGISSDVGHGELGFLKRRRLGRSLKSETYTHAIVIPRSWKSALIPFFAGVPVRTGYKGEMRYGLLNKIRSLDKTVLKQTVQRYVALGKEGKVNQAPETPFPELRINVEHQEKLLHKFSLAKTSPVVCMMPGAEYGPAKQWPVKSYALLAKSLVEQGFQVWVLGSSKDAAAGQQIVNECPDTKNLCGKTELVDTIDLLACAQKVVSNDSGLMHVAAAVGSEVLVVYGSSTPDYTPPLTAESKQHVFYLNLDCSPCFKRECPLGHTDCLNNIKYESLYKTILE